MILLNLPNKVYEEHSNMRLYIDKCMIEIGKDESVSPQKDILLFCFVVVFIVICGFSCFAITNKKLKNDDFDYRLKAYQENQQQQQQKRPRTPLKRNYQVRL